MTAQEAIENLKYMISDNCTDTQSDFIDEIEIAISALEKQIPKKPKEIHEIACEDVYYLAFVCPSCNTSVFGQPYRPNYCKHCGQALDWSDSE